MGDVKLYWLYILKGAIGTGEQPTLYLFNRCSGGYEASDENLQHVSNAIKNGKSGTIPFS